METPKAPSRMSRSRQRRSRIRLLAIERSELERRVAARTTSQQDAYPAQIILRVAAGHTDASIAEAMGFGRTHRLALAPLLRRTAAGRPQRLPKVSTNSAVPC